MSAFMKIGAACLSLALLFAPAAAARAEFYAQSGRYSVGRRACEKNLNLYKDHSMGRFYDHHQNGYLEHSRVPRSGYYGRYYRRDYGDRDYISNGARFSDRGYAPGFGSSTFESTRRKAGGAPSDARSRLLR